MNTVVYIYSFVILCDVNIAIQKPKIEIIPPSGILFNITDEGYDLVGVHYSINTALKNNVAGRWNFDVNKGGNAWIHRNPSANVVPGDTIYYWLNVRPTRTGLQEELLNQIYILPGNVSIISSSTPVIEITTTSSNQPSRSITTPVRSTTERNYGKRFPNRPDKRKETPVRSATEGNIGNKPNQENDSYTPRMITTTLRTGTASYYKRDLIYAVAGGVTGSILVICVTIICICCTRKRQTSGKQENKINERPQFKTPSQGGRNFEQTTEESTFNHHAARTDAHIPTISQHLYDYPDANPPNHQYDRQHSYEPLSADRGDLQHNSHKYDHLSYPHSYLELDVREDN